MQVGGGRAGRGRCVGAGAVDVDENKCLYVSDCNNLANLQFDHNVDWRMLITAAQ